MMADSGDLKTQEKIIPRPISTQQQKGDAVDLCGVSIERKIESIESLASKVSNRRSRRWLNERLLIELVPLLNAEEIRGLFAPPPWGDTARSSPFCMTNMGEWDSFRNIDMDVEASMIEAHKKSTKIKDQPLTDEMVAINAWHRVDRRTREALRRNFLSKLVENFEEHIVTFIKESKDGDVLVLQVEDSFHRLLLHGVCEFYNLVSATVTRPFKTAKETKLFKTTHIKKKKSGSQEVPRIKLAQFLKMAKDGIGSSPNSKNA